MPEYRQEEWQSMISQGISMTSLYSSHFHAIFQSKLSSNSNQFVRLQRRFLLNIVGGNAKGVNIL